VTVGAGLNCVALDCNGHLHCAFVCAPCVDERVNVVGMPHLGRVITGVSWIEVVYLATKEAIIRKQEGTLDTTRNTCPSSLQVVHLRSLAHLSNDSVPKKFCHLMTLKMLE